MSHPLFYLLLVTIKKNIYMSLHTHTQHLTLLVLINHEANQKCPIIIQRQLPKKRAGFFIIVIIQEYETSSKIPCNVAHFQETVLVRGTVQGYYLRLPGGA